MDAEIIENTVKAQLAALREECGGYIVYVFKLMDGTPPYDEYIMCTRFPNWQAPNISLEDEGFLKYREVLAGIHSWYDRESESWVKYKYTGVHFLDFVHYKSKIKELII